MEAYSLHSYLLQTTRPLPTILQHPNLPSPLFALHKQPPTSSASSHTSSLLLLAHRPTHLSRFNSVHSRDLPDPYRPSTFPYSSRCLSLSSPHSRSASPLLLLLHTIPYHTCLYLPSNLHSSQETVYHSCPSLLYTSFSPFAFRLLFFFFVLHFAPYFDTRIFSIERERESAKPA
jgi:hypothetical protein